MPKVWAHICIQRMAELAKESSTMRRVLDPMFGYFDSGRHWVPQQGLAIMVLSDVLYFMDSSGILSPLRLLPQCMRLCYTTVIQYVTLSGLLFFLPSLLYFQRVGCQILVSAIHICMVL